MSQENKKKNYTISKIARKVDVTFKDFFFYYLEMIGLPGIAKII